MSKITLRRFLVKYMHAGPNEQEVTKMFEAYADLTQDGIKCDTAFIVIFGVDLLSIYGEDGELSQYNNFPVKDLS